MSLRRYLPWWLRIGLKIALARLPLDYHFWKRLHLFEHGKMDQPKFALQTYLTFSQIAGLSPPYSKPLVVLELGPGDSLFTALIARAMGASKVWLVDAGRFATTDLVAYESMVLHLSEKGYHLSGVDFRKSQSLDEILSICNATYLTDGISSLKQIPDSSVDFCFSNAVLEHIPKQDFSSMTNELKRILRPDGVSVHRVDLKDHLGGGLNNLRFSERLWESRFFSRSGFYTNRIRFSQMLEIFKKAGFKCEVPRKILWDRLPISRKALAKEFQVFSDEDLLVQGFDVILRRQTSQNRRL